MYRVLIIDSDQDARFIINKFPWIHYGFDVPEEAASGREALERLSSGTIDLMLTDIRLPDMDGLEFLRLVSNDSNPCTVLLSNYNDFEYAQQGISMGVFDYLVKPLSTQNFHNVMQRVEIFLHRINNNHNFFDGKEEVAKESDCVDIGGKTYNKENLAEMLMEGNESFLVAVKKFIKENEQQDLGIAAEFLHKAFYKNFPWMNNIAPVEMGDLIDISEKFYEQLSQYDLLQPNSLFRSICEFVCCNIEEGMSLRMVADQLDISADYAGRIFKKRSGIHFATFVMEIKMERGKQLLSKSKLKNYEISNRLGYSNPDYFRQLFKAYTGITPTEYRNIHRHMSYK